MKKGDIVLVPFPFTNLKGNKIRPALILCVGFYDATVCFISSIINWKEETDIILDPDKENGLKKKSLIKTSKIVTIDKKLIIGKLGNISTADILELDGALIKLFKIRDIR